MSALVAASPTVPAIDLRGLVRDFAVGLRGVKLRAVDGLTLSVASGQVFGLLGPNGSGKSTTIKMILGLLRPSAGTCAVFGIPGGEIEARREVGYLPESPSFYRHLTGRELVRFYARMCGLPGAEAIARSDATIAQVGLAGAADRRVGTYSKGMLQRIGIAQAIVHDPSLVILDEPTAGLDPMGTEDVSTLILDLKRRGKTVLVTSHLLGQIEEICDRVAILDRGRLMLEGAVAELVGRAEPPVPAWRVDGLPPGELAALREWLAARGGTLASVTAPRTRLDRVFLDHVAPRDRS